LESARIRGISVQGNKRKLCTKRDTLKRKIRANKGKNSHFQFGYWTFVNESSARSTTPETFRLSNLPELENGEIKIPEEEKKNKEVGGDWLLHDTAGKTKLVEGIC